MDDSCTDFRTLATDQFQIALRTLLANSPLPTPPPLRCQWSVDITSFSKTAFGRRSEIMRKFAVRRWGRLCVIAPLTGRIARYVRILFNQVHYCPGGRGYSKARDNFQKLAKKHLE